MNARIAILLILAACAPRSVESEGGSVVESAPDCAACTSDMVACVSTSRGDAQFMECRDLFGACQTKAKIEPGVCASPRGEDACALCSDRQSLCVATDPDPGHCAQDLDVCLSRLDVAGGTCEPDPSGPGPSATSGGSTGAGGAGGAGDASGGAGGATDGAGGSIAIPCHEPCEIGGALYPECSACVAAVCAADPYCCTTAWDKYCVQGAEKAPLCSCVPAACAHDECTNGVALSASCSPCANDVCDKQPTCCTVEWTIDCATVAQTVAGCGCMP